MPNRLYNKQITPKGYKRGGGVTDKKSNKKSGTKYKLGTKFQGDYKGKSVPGKVKEFVKTAVKQNVGTAKEIGKVFRTKKMGGGMMKRSMYKRGGPLKPVDPKTQKGLSKLPTEVRNEMGYMKKGGKVHGK